ncbi:unnamed protein product [Orchesella dallaii]|uniref:Uncharacterized protein n=1 Tax=Orchesella dallaii TaxID=48710 RepID=A0ABP1QBB2_9HEXA
MARFYISSLFLLHIATLLNALPAMRLSREVSAPPITVIQTSLTASGQSTFEGDSKYCINVRDVKVPTKIEVTQTDPEEYNLISFSTDCSAIDSAEITTQSLRNPVVINARRPICSFKLRESEGTPVSITFTGSTSRTFEVASTKCINICSGPESAYPSLAYALSVNIKAVGGQRQTNNGIHLFSEVECGTPFGNEPVTDGASLIEMTVKDTRVVKSFMVKEKK